MEMHQVRYFLAVARTLNFSQAAQECRVSQPSLSQAIKKLEEELGGQLFRRERSLTHLTDLGRMMVPLLAQCHESALAARELTSSAGKGSFAPLRLGLSHTVSLELLVPALRELVRHFPGLEFAFLRGNAEETMQRLKTGDCELAVAASLPGDWERLDSYPLFSEGYRLAVELAHAYAMRNAVTITDIVGQRLLPRAYCEQAENLGIVLAPHGLRRQTGDEIASDQDLFALIEAGLGVAIVPESALPAGRLRGLEVIGLDLRRIVSVYTVAGRQRNLAASTLVKLLRAADWARLSSTRTEATLAQTAGV